MNRERLILSGMLMCLLAPATAAVGDDITIPITPSQQLTLDGQPVTEGQFVLELGRAWLRYGNVPLGMDVVTPSAPVTVDTTMGSDQAYPLFDAPGATQALQLEGYFDAAGPVEPVYFSIWVSTFTDNMLSNFRYFLPMNSGDFAYQVTDVGPSVVLADNTDTFWSGEPTAFVDDTTGLIGIMPAGDQVSMPFQPQGATPAPGTIVPLAAGVLVLRRRRRM